MRSLTSKLTLAFLFVGLLGAILVAFFVKQSTQREFDLFVLDRHLTTLTKNLSEFYQTNGGWQGVNAVFEQNRSNLTGPDGRLLPLTLVGSDGRVVFVVDPDRSRYRPGDDVSAYKRELGMSIKANGKVAGWLLLSPFRSPPDRGTPEAAFLARMSRAIIYSALGAAAFALLLGVVLARTLSRPIRELTAATRAMAKGDLDQRVTVRSRDELGELAASFNQMSADLAEANRLRRQMTADIAHDLRTPLSVILGYTEALADSKLQGTSETFEIMHDEARHLSHLVEDLRTLSLADAGELPLTRRPVAPQALLDRTVAAHKAQAQQQKISLAIKAEPNLPEVEVDPERMAQVLGNLVCNALRYTPAGGEIVLSAEALPHTLLLRVRDTGAGINPEVLPHIFERFYRADKSRSQNGESGLGLPIARSLVEMHGGNISAESTPGQGATFTISLPLS